MLNKMLKIVKTIDTCKFLHQIKGCEIMIENFDRDEKPRDDRIITGLMTYYEVKRDKLIRISKSNPKNINCMKAEIKDKDGQILAALGTVGFAIKKINLELMLNIIDFVRSNPKRDSTLKDIIEIKELVNSLFED